MKTSNCSIRSLWSGLDLIVDQILKRTRLADLARAERPMSAWIREQMPAILAAATAHVASPALAGAAR